MQSKTFRLDQKILELCIVVYNAAFEKTRIKELVEKFSKGIL